MRSIISKIWRQFAVATIACAVIFTYTGAPAHAALLGLKTINGYAHDVKVYAANGALTAGPVSAAGVGCSDRPPLYYADGVANVSVGGVTLGTSNTVSQASLSGTVETVTSTFSATGVNIPLLLSMSLKADAITVTSTVTYDTSSNAFTNSSAMTVTNLTVGAPLVPPVISINGVVAPDQAAISIPGVATIGFHQTQLLGSAAAGVQGKMATGIKLQIAGSTLNVSVGETYAALYGATDQNWMFGAGNGAQVQTSDSTLAVGPLVTSQLPCSGGGPVTASLPSVTLPGTLGTLGAISTSAQGSRSDLNATATTTAQAAGVNLVGGLVTADAVGSQSQVSTTDGGATISTAGTSSTLTNLVVAGVPVAVNPAINTIIPLPGLGYVVVNGRTNYPSGVETIPLVVHLDPAGATPAIDIVVARSYAVILGPNSSTATTASTRAALSDGLMQTSITKDLSTGSLAKAGLKPKDAHAIGKGRIIAVRGHAVTNNSKGQLVTHIR